MPTNADTPDPRDFVGHTQLVQMATFFGMKGRELKKVNLMAERAESSRPQLSPTASSLLPVSR